MNYIELTPREVINYFKSENVVGMGRFGILYQYDIDSLIKLYYKEYISAYMSKRASDFKREMDINIELMNLNFDFNKNERLIELSNRLENTSSKGFIKALVMNRGYRIGIIEPYYKDYDILGNKIYDFSYEKRKYILEKTKEKIYELFSNGIYPLDIKEDNILLNDNMDIKLIDLDGDDVRIEEEDYIISHPHIKRESENKIIEMEYRLLRHQ